MRHWGTYLIIMLSLTMLLAPCAAAQSLEYEVIEEADALMLPAEGSRVFYAQADWSFFWNSSMEAAHGNASYPPASEVDFGQYMVVGVFWGVKTGQNWSVEITGVEETTDNVVVEVRLRHPDNETVLQDIAAYPCQFVKVARSQKNVTFEYENVWGEDDMGEVVFYMVCTIFLVVIIVVIIVVLIARRDAIAELMQAPAKDRQYVGRRGMGKELRVVPHPGPAVRMHAGQLAESIGVQGPGGRMKTLIPAHAIGLRAQMDVSIAEDNQSTLEIDVYQGNSPMAEDNRRLTTFKVCDIPPAFKHQPKITLSFEITGEDGLNLEAWLRSKVMRCQACYRDVVAERMDRKTWRCPACKDEFTEW